VTATDTVTGFGWAVIAAAVLSAVLGSITYLTASSRATRDRRRQLYSDAFRAATSWVEVLYRVRRRSEASQDAIVSRLHQIYEEIEYFQGWLSTEAPELGRSYATLVEAIRMKVNEPLRVAWSVPARPPWVGTPTNEVLPDVREAEEKYLQDIRDHLSPWWWVQRRVKERNPPKPGATPGSIGWSLPT
jgi:hypothetical protein